MIDISVRSNIKEITKKLDAFAYQQIPYAIALGNAELARVVAAAEQENMKVVLDRPTAFTVKSVKAKAGNKRNPTAEVRMGDIAAAYLDAFEFGGPRKHVGPKLMVPTRFATTNQYGNIPRGTWAKMQNRSDVFVGEVKMKSGHIIHGVWQRDAGKASAVKVKRKKNGQIVIGMTKKGLNQSGRLKLLVELDRVEQPTQELGYVPLANKVINKEFNRVFGASLAKAIKTAR
jgi:hypothetical protein